MKFCRDAAETERRFWARVQKTETCWLWTGTKNEYGYGCIKIGGRKGRLLKTHRFAWQLTNGPIPDGLIILHKCDVPACVNPDHLRLGTHADNVADKHNKGRARYGWLPGEKNGASLLDDQTVLLIRNLVASGIPQARLARQVGVTPTTICDVVKRRTWKHI